MISYAHEVHHRDWPHNFQSDVSLWLNFTVAHRDATIQQYKRTTSISEFHHPLHPGLFKTAITKTFTIQLPSALFTPQNSQKLNTFTAKLQATFTSFKAPKSPCNLTQGTFIP